MSKELSEFIEKLKNNLETMYKHYDYKQRGDSKHKYRFKEVKKFIKKFYKALENEDDKMRKYYDPKKIENKTMTFLIGNNKELEALDEISKKLTMYDRFYSLSNYTNDIKPIREALILKKKLENAIEIIKNRRVDFYTFKSSENPKEYNDSRAFINDELTEEEFKLLEEVFGNGR